ncbi:MAG: hypothetical protein MJ106_03895 [Lentisphaeria bacterium]|nr:hypothetical protein [Lentisphaeria bacterium]
MRNTILFFLAFFCGAMLFGAVAPGTNILANGELKTDRTDTPPLYWGATEQTGNVEFCLSGGPEDKPYIRFSSTSADKPATTTYRQLDLKLVAGEPYKLSAWIKATNFKCNVRGVSICNTGWQNFSGVTPANGTYGWTYLEKEFTMLDSVDGKYFAAIFADKYTGEFCVADIRLTALSKAAQKGSEAPKMEDLTGQLRMIPWEPLLCQIPSENPVVSFRLYGKVEDMDSVDVALNFDGRVIAVVQPLAKDINTLRLPKAVRGGRLTVVLRNRKSGEELYRKSHPFAVVDLPKVETGSQKRLNNLCTELLNQRLEAKAEAQQFSFAKLRGGWLFIAVQDGAADGLEVVLDGKQVIIDGDSRNNETFREAAIGNHTLTVKNAVNGGRLIVRDIAETLTYCPCTDSFVRENPPYDWDFHYKYSLPAVTSQNGGSIPEDKLEWFHRQGYHWIANQMSTKLESDDDLTSRLNQSAGMIEDRYDGVTCDEQFFFQPAMLERYTRGLHDYANPKNRMIFSWIVGKPATPGVDQDYISESLNACGGRGQLLLEAYCRTGKDEAAAREIIDDKIVDNTLKISNAFPNVLKSFGVILGNFNQMPIISLHHHPQVDMKYFLDMQLNRVANDPLFDGLATVGYWGGYYADHEFHRWSYMLLRHYVVEGKKTMLSDEYGFTYCPGHVVNGDFQDGFKGWKKSGNVTLDKVVGYAGVSQTRWGGNDGVGDTFAVLSKKSDEISTLTQTARKLIPGRAYVLQFATCDVDRIKGHDATPGDYGIRATFADGAEIRQDLSWQHIHDCMAQGCREHAPGVALINLHHIVFIATKEEVDITLDNRLAKPGENLCVNFFSVLPFLLEE